MRELARRVPLTHSRHPERSRSSGGGEPALSEVEGDLAGIATAARNPLGRHPERSRPSGGGEPALSEVEGDLAGIATAARNPLGRHPERSVLQAERSLP